MLPRPETHLKQTRFVEVDSIACAHAYTLTHAQKLYGSGYTPTATVMCDVIMKRRVYARIRIGAGTAA